MSLISLIFVCIGGALQYEGDNMSRYHNGMPFSTYDQDHDDWVDDNCAEVYFHFKINISDSTSRSQTCDRHEFIGIGLLCISNSFQPGNYIIIFSESIV